MTVKITKQEVDLRDKITSLENPTVWTPPSFRVDLASAPTVATSVWTTYPASTVHWDTHGAYEADTYTYVVPVTGIYMFLCTNWWSNMPEGRTISRILINGDAAAYHYELTNTGGSWTHQSMHNLSKGDRIQIQVHQASGSSQLMDPNNLNNGWTGVMVSGHNTYGRG